MIVLEIERMRVRSGTQRAPTIFKMCYTLSWVLVKLFCIPFEYLK